MRRRRIELKLLVLAHYGKRKQLLCRWRGCEISDPYMLTLDHIDNNGGKERKTGHLNGIERLFHRGLPKGYQTLCCNHQRKKEVLRRIREAEWL